MLRHRDDPMELFAWHPSSAWPWSPSQPTSTRDWPTRSCFTTAMLTCADLRYAPCRAGGGTGILVVGDLKAVAAWRPQGGGDEPAPSRR